MTTTSAPAFAATSALLGPERIVFGSDYPYVPIAATSDGLRALEMRPDSLEEIGRGNAEALLGERAHTE